MTLYSTHDVHCIRYVDGDLSTDPETRADEFTQVVLCLTAGTCRALLDAAKDLADEGAVVRAEQWHTEVEGWEIDAVHTQGRQELRRIVARFARVNLLDIITLAEFIAWNPKASEETWHGNSGMGMYRVGMLLGHTLAGTGVDFLDYSWPELGTIPDRLRAWVEDLGRDVWHYQDVWIDSTEEPCLLHLKP